MHKGLDFYANPEDRLRLHHKIRDEGKVQNELRYHSTHDALTGVYNRTYFEAELERLQKGRRFPVSIIMLDTDDLKQSNDTYGHARGDQLLQTLANLLQVILRGEEVFASAGTSSPYCCHTQKQTPPARSSHGSRLSWANTPVKMGTSTSKSRLAWAWPTKKKTIDRTKKSAYPGLPNVSIPQVFKSNLIHPHNPGFQSGILNRFLRWFRQQGSWYIPLLTCQQIFL